MINSIMLPLMKLEKYISKLMHCLLFYNSIDKKTFSEFKIVNSFKRIYYYFSKNGKFIRQHELLCHPFA